MWGFGFDLYLDRDIFRSRLKPLPQLDSEQ